MNNLIILFVTGFYSGYFPIASGTVGTLVGIVLYLVMNRFLNIPYYIAVTLIVFFAGIFASSKAEIIFGRKDSGKIVIDEIVGFMVTMFALPFSWKYILAGFFLFRIFDVIKPFPIRKLEQLEGGFGVMSDDFIAGIYSNILLQAWKYFFQ